MLFIREDTKVLRILAADRKRALHREEAALPVPIIDGYCVDPGIGDEEMPGLRIRRKAHLTGRNQRVILRIAVGLDRLDPLEKDVIPSLFLRKAVDIDDILQLIHEVEELPVRAEAEVPRTGLKLTAERIDLAHLPVRFVEAEDADLIDAEIRHQDILLIVRHAGAGDMGAEGPLGDGADPLVIDAVDDGPDGAVLFELQKRRLPIVIPGYDQILILLINGEMTAPHVADIPTVQAGESSIFQDAEGDHTLIRDRVERPLIPRSHKIRGIIHLHLCPLLKDPLFGIHIADRNPLRGAGIGIGAHISRVSFLHPSASLEKAALPCPLRPASLKSGNAGLADIRPCLLSVSAFTKIR